MLDLQGHHKGFWIVFPILLDLQGFPKDCLSNSTRSRRFAKISCRFPIEIEQSCKDILNISLLILLEALESSQGFSCGFPFCFHSVCEGFLRKFPEISPGFLNNFLWISFRFPFIIIGCGPRKQSPEAPPALPTPRHKRNSTSQRHLNV